MNALADKPATPSAGPNGGATSNVYSMKDAALRRLGMIASSPSWRRHWMEIRWKKYPWVGKTDK